MNKFSILCFLLLNCLMASADNELQKMQNEILFLKSSIHQTNKDIHIKNQEYKRVHQELTIFDDQVKMINYRLIEYKKKIKSDYVNLQKHWNVLLIQQADPLRHSEYLLTHKNAIKNMKLRSDSLKKNISWATSLETQLALASKQSDELRKKSEVLLELIQKLESKNIVISSKIKEKNISTQKVENNIITNTLESQLRKGDYFLAKEFQLPLAKYKKIEQSSSGLNFYYHETSWLLAPGSGKVIYIGELSNYGHVIMIEHEKNMISVLLGNITTELTEASFVSKGSIIGKLIARNDEGTNSLYYEIRKEEKPVPILSYLKINP